jgi:peptidoglycan/LPS O-acetylase OafA/YrhL
MQPVIIATFIVLFAFGLVYNVLVAWVERTGRSEGYVAFLVAGGNLVICAAVALAYDPRAAGVCLAFNTAAGVPMILGSWWRHTNRRRHDASVAAELARTILASAGSTAQEDDA